MATDDYVAGVVCLFKSLKKVTNYPLYCIGINISKENNLLLQSLGCQVIELERLTSKTCKPHPYYKNLDFADNCFNKIHLWNQDYDKIIYLDADIIVIKNIDHLFELDYEFAAGSSFQTEYCSRTGKPLQGGWKSDYFNAGFLVLKPSKQVYSDLMIMKDTVETPKDPSDQGLLNYYFRNKWHRLKPIYNFTRRVHDVAPKKYQEMKNDICVLHFTLEKPWNKKEDTEINKMWWSINDS